MASSKSASPSEGRRWTVSLALPGSIVDNSQTDELKTYLAGQVARALTIFNIDEVVIFKTETLPKSKRSDGAVFLARLLQYLDCPQYLRKNIFPMHPDLRFVGLVNPLDATNHPRKNEDCQYREGVVTSTKRAGPFGSNSSWVHVGLYKEVQIDQDIPEGTRVTVKLAAPSSKGAAATVVSPSEPREEKGLHWGYTVRVAESLPAVWSDCPFEGGYDISIGTSDKGQSEWLESSQNFPTFSHLLIVFGGVEGLEPNVESEPCLARFGAEAGDLFDMYLNLCPTQGSRTIRTEEALLIGLASLQPRILHAMNSC